MRRRSAFGPVLALSLALSLCLAGPTEAEDRYYTTESDVRLTGRMETVLGRIARRYHERTGRRLHVTSGTRTPREQAEAMYDKIRLGVHLTRVYRDYEAAAAIQAAYRSHRRRGRSRCVRAMASVIEDQVRRGTFISRHLQSNAVDVRSRDMSRRQQRVFRDVVRGVGGVELLQEGRPPHFHLQL